MGLSGYLLRCWNAHGVLGQCYLLTRVLTIVCCLPLTSSWCENKITQQKSVANSTGVSFFSSWKTFSHSQKCSELLASVPPVPTNSTLFIFAGKCIQCNVSSLYLFGQDLRVDQSDFKLTEIYLPRLLSTLVFVIKPCILRENGFLTILHLNIYISY